MTVPDPKLGAYGLRLLGVESAGELLVPALDGWPSLEVVQRSGRAPSAQNRVDDDGAVLRLLHGGQVEIDRIESRAVFTLPESLEAAVLVHPYLAPVAAVIARWHDRESFHAGAFVHDGGVWALLGDRESGKSSTLAWLALEGHEIVCDDMLILEGAVAFAGPRSVDLRPEAARYLGVGEPLGVVGARERWRMILDPLGGSLPLQGWIFLDWSDRVEIAPVPPAERVEMLFPQRGLRLPPRDPAALLELAALPSWRLRRPRGLESVPEAGRDLLALLRD